jgi:allophycocyanin-B
MSIVKQVILNADEEVRYPTPGEIRMIQNFCKTGEERIRLATILAKNEKKIVERATPKFWKLCSKTPSNSGNAQKTEAAMRDVSWYIRLVSYCLLAGNDRPLVEIGLIGMKELYNNVLVPLENVRQYLLCIREEVSQLLSNEDAAEVIPYFDQILQVISSPGAPYFMNDGRADW